MAEDQDKDGSDQTTKAAEKPDEKKDAPKSIRLHRTRAMFSMRPPKDSGQ